MKKFTVILFIALFLFIPVMPDNEIPDILTEEHDFRAPNLESNSKVTDSLMPRNIFSYFFSSLKKSINDIPATLSALLVIIFLSSITGIFIKNSSLSKIPEYCSCQ